MKTLFEEVVVVTGANNGLGFHLAESLLSSGYRVAALDLSIENISEFQDEYPERLLSCPCDITPVGDVQRAVEEIMAKWGRIDILVNNAALAIFRAFEEKPLEETQKEFEVNYFGSLRMILAVLPIMKAQGKGIIHNVSSGVGFTGFPSLYGYCSTKGAIESLSRTLDMELEPYGIHVTLMHPPLMNTKSAAPLGIPAQAMDDPARVARKLAKKIKSVKPVVTPDLRTAIYLFFARRYPSFMGKLFSKLAERGRRENHSVERSL